MNMQSEQINELITALSKAQGEIKNANKTSVNPHYKSKYADLTEFWEACREPLSKHGLAVIQTMGRDDKEMVSLITTLAHSSGQWVKSVYPLICKDSTNPQAMGSAITYGRRYSLAAIIGIAPDEPDDDAEKAMNRGEKKKEPPRMINADEWNELCHLIGKCDKNFQETTWKFLEGKEIFSFEKMPSDLFYRIKRGANENIRSQEKIHAIGQN